MTALPQDLRLIAGVGDRAEHTACLMSAAAWIAGEDATDAPSCVCPSIRNLAIRLNDGSWWDDDAERTAALMPLAHRIVGTSQGPELAARRRDLTRAWLRITIVPGAFEAAADVFDRRSFGEHAVKLREQAKLIREGGSYEDARRIAYDAYAAAAAAYAAAAAAAYAAAAAAYDAADAADYAAAAADYAAAAADAAYDAADAAYDADYAAAAADAGDYAAAAAIRRSARKPVRDALKAHIEALVEVTP